jgi:Mce-associated membrane protein
VENQQFDPDDLTDAHCDRDAPAADVATGSSETEPDHPAATPCAGGAKTRRDVWLAGAIAAAVVLFVGTAAFAGAAIEPHLADRATAATKLNFARTAAAAITTLWTYTPDKIDSLPDRAGRYLSGDFYAQYRKFLEAAIAPNKQAQVTDKTDVVRVGVESLNGTDAVAIVFTNTTATSPLTNNIPSLKYVAYRLAMKQQGSQWLVTNMATIGFMDLTPKT